MQDGGWDSVGEGLGGIGWMHPYINGWI